MRLFWHFSWTLNWTVLFHKCNVKSEVVINNKEKSHLKWVILQIWYLSQALLVCLSDNGIAFLKSIVNSHCLSMKKKKTLGIARRWSSQGHLSHLFCLTLNYIIFRKHSSFIWTLRRINTSPVNTIENVYYFRVMDN